MLLHGFTSYCCISLLILWSFPNGPGVPVFVYITVIGGDLLSCFFFYCSENDTFSHWSRSPSVCLYNHWCCDISCVPAVSVHLSGIFEQTPV